MSDSTIRAHDERLFLLNAIELVAAIFRGPDKAGWTSIFDSGLPELIKSVPQKTGHLTVTLNNLQDSRPTLSEIQDSLAILETEYVRLFVAAGGGIAAPLYESCHLDTAPHIMGDSALSMRSRLNQCGLEVALESNEPPDHISLELEYLYHLLATAWTENNPALEAMGREFARLDMLPWVRRFRTALIKGAPHPVYANTADFTVAVLETIGG